MNRRSFVASVVALLPLGWFREIKSNGRKPRMNRPLIEVESVIRGEYSSVKKLLGGSITITESYDMSSPNRQAIVDDSIGRDVRAATKQQLVTVNVPEVVENWKRIQDMVGKEGDVFQFFVRGV